MTAKTADEEQQTSPSAAAAKKTAGSLPKLPIRWSIQSTMSDEQAFVALIDRAAHDPEFDVQNGRLMKARAANRRSAGARPSQGNLQDAGEARNHAARL